MKSPESLGMNRTGVAMSPLDTAKLYEVEIQPLNGTMQELLQLRAGVMQSVGPLGTVPLPGSIKGVASTVLQKLKGEHPEVMLDKLGERIAFERTGVRLYDLLLNKIQARPEEAKGFDVAMIETNRNEELRHFVMLCDAMRQLGGDPTAMTPAADVTGVLASGIVQVLSEARTTVAQAMQAMLVVELADNDAWMLLIQLAEEQDLQDMAADFRLAEAEERRHLADIRAIMAQQVLKRMPAVH